MKICFIMDPIERVNIDADTSFALMLGAQQRGHQVAFMKMEDLSARGATALGRFVDVKVKRAYGDHYELGEWRTGPLSEFDAIFMRKDPPFDVDYLHACHILDLAERQGVLVVNKPTGLRIANEKLYALNFEDVLPDTLVTRDVATIREFLADAGGKCILKPVDGHGGAGIFMLEEGDRNLNAILEVSTREGAERVICQRYVPEAREGDKRIIMLDGEPLGAILRVPREDDNRGNIHVGGSVVKTTLTDRDRQICESVGPRLSEDGLWFVGLDVIGGHLTEVNVTSPTGIQEMSRLDGFDGPDLVMQWAEKKIAG